MLKVCTKCKIEKDVKEFHLQRDKKSGLRSACKMCRVLEKKRYYEIHKKEKAITDKAYRKKNAAKLRIDCINRRAKKKGNGGTHTLKEWNALKERYDYTCLCCKRQEPEIKLTEDHITPLSKGGVNSIDNIQPLCLSCNCSKNDKIIDYR